MNIYNQIRNENIITLRQGVQNGGTATFTDSVSGLPVDLTGATATGQVRSVIGSELATMVCTIPAPLTGVINYSLTSAELAKLVPTDNITHVWGIQISGAATVIPELHGGAIIEPEVVTP